MVLLRKISLWISRRVSLLLEKNRKSVVSKGPSTASSKLLEARTHVFDEVIWGYDFIKNDCDPCIYKKIGGSSVVYLVLYVNDILLIANDVKMLGDIKAWLSTQFSMKDMGETSYILGIKIYRDRSRRMLGLTQSSYIEKCTRPDVAYALSVTSRYQACAGEAHWGTVKSIFKYLKRTKDMFLIYGGGELILEGYSDASFHMMPNPNQVLYSSLMVVWSLGRVPSKIPQQIPPRKLNTSQLRKLPMRRFG
ncbi:UNVERIFIED_CONTAM: Retrovirus-related Pol polyprotein from transposon TNT 1-94 [Sesamum radiatum]|uniref:Retrovirus-related Pol polyprotein from transposon TNT 1-94 n=1 Tax=Sesamum radiatum TaxID=300843 RepID=A0AAW2I975_SESRA